MGVVCHIFLNKTHGGVFYSGQNVSGVVKYVIDKPTEYQQVLLTILGTGKCRWSKMDGDGESNFYHGSEEYVNATISLMQNTKPVLLQPGHYEYPFQFHLPENIPSSFKSKECNIKYQIKVRFEKAKLFSFSKKLKVEIPVYGVVRSSDQPIHFQMQKNISKLFSSKEHKIYVRGLIAEPIVSPGQIIEMKLNVNNNSDTKPRISVELKRCKKLTARSKNTIVVKDRIKDSYVITGEIAKRSEVNITLRVPTKPEIYTIRSKILNIEYTLKIVIQMPGLTSNSILKVPIVIGLKRGLEYITLRDVPTWEMMMDDDEKDHR